MLRVSLLLLFIPICFALTECHLEHIRYESPSLCRCVSAILYGFTDKPPFDGKSVTLEFSSDYNETELEETIRILGPERVLESDISCKANERKNEAERTERERKEQERTQKWREQAESQNVEQKCAEAWEELEKSNNAKWFWQSKDYPQWYTTGKERFWNLCPCFRENEWIDPENQEWVWKADQHPCVEVACLKEGGPLRKRESCVNEYGSSGINGLMRYTVPCINTIKLKT